MVLPGRIELPTSPLPRECSTTELRQRTVLFRRADTCHRRLAGATPSLDGRAGVIGNWGMSSKQTSAEERKARLAKALKRNIARRKAPAKPKSPPVEKDGPPPEENGCPN
jgi:hypothetical protein